jgi:hypothetical protein
MGSHELVVDGHPVVVQVRQSTRARRLRLVVAPGRPPELVVPARTRDRAVEEFLDSQQRWLGDRLAALRVLAQRPSVVPRRPGEVWLAGRSVPVEHDPAGRAGAALRDGRLVLGGDRADARAVLERWYRGEARRRLTRTVDAHAPGLDVRVPAISVRDQRTRWGSCSQTGRLSFSWRLVLAPPPVLGYVALHELCHLREFNHSPAFWRLVESARPDWREATGWLRAHGHELHSYRPELALATDTLPATG